MTFDLEGAIGAARARADDAAAADDGMATKLRVRESLAARTRGKRRRFVVLGAIAASLFGSTAFAYMSGWRPQAWFASSSPAPVEPIVLPDAPVKVAIASIPADAPVEVAVQSPPPAQELPTAPRIEAVVPPVTPRVRAPISAHVEAVDPSVRAAPAHVEVVVPPVTPPVRAVTPSVTPLVPPATPSPSEELAVYRAAHEAHFHGTDPVAALAAWDAYLARYPSGTFAIDARYDRALVLVKLHRYTEARAALAPFAKGTYKAAEAAKLVAALPHSP